MNYTCEVTINLPRERVVALFDDPENLAKWQPGLTVFEPLDGTPGQPGATTRLVYESDKRTVEMVETVISRSLPEEFSATYEAGKVWNKVVNHFIEDGPDRTRWQAEHEFKLGGLLALMGFFMPGMFRRQTEKDMNAFKAFAESA